MSLQRAIATVAGYTVISRISGFARDIVMAGLVGTQLVADCFVVAFKLPNFFRRLFAEGAFNAAFVPLFTEKVAEDGEKGRENALRFAEESGTVLLTVLLIFVALVQALMPFLILVLAYGFKDDPAKFDLAVTLTRITFPYLIFISLVSLLGGVLNALGRFAAAASTPILLNISLIACGLLLTSYLPTAGHALAVGVTLGGLLQFVWLLAALKREGIRMRVRRPRLTPEVKRLLILMAPIALGAGAVQINLLIDVLIASFLPDGSLAYLFYADRLNQLPVGIIGVAAGTALLPTLSRQLSEGQGPQAMNSLNRSVETTLLLTIPAAVALFLIPEQIIGVLFERGAFTADSTVQTAMALSAYALGLPAYILLKVLSPAFFARQDTATPVRIGILALVVNTVLNVILMFPLKHVGLALATAISAWLNVSLLTVALFRRGYWQMDTRLKTRLTKGIICTAVMGVGVWFGAGALEASFRGGQAERAGALLMVVLGGAGLYGIFVHFTGALRISEAKGLLRRSGGQDEPG